MVGKARSFQEFNGLRHLVGAEGEIVMKIFFDAGTNAERDS
jgi:hypothetical protein